jgi:glycosyltransferase involved in cell wall biosynthesis
MIFAVITHVKHSRQGDDYFAYRPYVDEINIWLRYVDKAIIVAPISSALITDIHQKYFHSTIEFRDIKSFDLIGPLSKIKSIFKIPKIIFEIFKAMKEADHIHLRCPGNIGLLGCLVQIFFPNKPKTAKYAGNWDPKSKQPLSYRFQKWILSNTFFTRNMQVLVYGEWPRQTKNIKPFFTATYYEKDKKAVAERNLGGKIKLMFAGALTKGKRPMYAIQMVEKLIQNGYDAQLEIFGEGPERDSLQEYISQNKFEATVFLMGNQTKERLQEAYGYSHFMVLPSQSEGWPKVVAEAMFFGCLPVATDVSCVSDMLDNGDRGLLLTMKLEDDIYNIINLINTPEVYQNKIEKAVNWSRKYTTDYFEEEIQKLIIK